MMPMVMPTFSKTWNSSMQSTPTQISVPKSSRASWAVRQIRQATMAKRASSVPAPTKPSSSPTAVKMKSVCCSGTLSSRVCVPSKRPWPSGPPAPMAIFDCSRL